MQNFTWNQQEFNTQYSTTSKSNSQTKSDCESLAVPVGNDTNHKLNSPQHIYFLNDSGPPPVLPPRKSASVTPPPLPPKNPIPYSVDPDQQQTIITPVIEWQFPHRQCYDTLNSPSSGFYSSCTSIESSSPTNVVLPEIDGAKLRKLLIMQSESTLVKKPFLQTAIAPIVITGPPSYSYTSLIPKETKCAQTNNDSTVKIQGQPDFLNFPKCLNRKPLINNKSKSIELENNKKIGVHKIDRESPIPQRTCKNMEQEEQKVQNYSPQAFKFFMEQHIENVVKSHKQRIFRRMQLEKEMAKIKVSPEAQSQLRKMLSQKESNYIRLKRARMDKSMFEKIKLIGVGAFGEVTLVEKTGSNRLYAMKTLRKADVLRKNQIAHVKAERDILAEADNEWVVKLYYSFQDKDNLYFVMEYIPGGDLMSLLIKFGIFEESLAKFYFAELTCAVESVHKIGFIHRDIKPDNILIDRDGHIKLTDFGLCTGFRWTHDTKYYENGDGNERGCLDFNENWNSNGNCKCMQLKLLERRREQHKRCLAHSLVGTPNYIAPEVLLRTGYTQLCDWWSVGVVLYEMLIGSPPFSANSPTETQYKIINWRNTLKIPPNVNVSPESVDLIKKLCTSSDKRLKNATQVKQHPFFCGIDFKKGMRRITPPYMPKINNSTDTSNFDPIYLSSSSSDESDLSEDSGNTSFHGFTFRRFFDDWSEIPFPTKINVEENVNCSFNSKLLT